MTRIQLQRLLETRRALLRREQAMAFARGLVAGFDMDNIDDLISFADAYGALRLRSELLETLDLWNSLLYSVWYSILIKRMNACYTGQKLC